MAEANGNRLDLLRRREEALKTAIAEEKVRQHKRREKEQARLCSIIGAVLVQNAAKHADFELMVKGVLQKTTSLGDGDKKLLRQKGWL